MIKFVKLLVLLLILWGFPGCEEEIVPPEAGPEFSIEVVKFPRVIDVSRALEYPVMFRVTHPDGPAAIAAVTARVLRPDLSVLQEITLYDDGGAVHADGDVIARDGVFSNFLVTDPQTFPTGMLQIRAAATEAAGETLESPLLEVRAVANFRPLLLGISAPDTLKSGSPPVRFSATVQDSNGIADVAGVVMELRRNGLAGSDTLRVTNPIAADRAEFFALLDSTYAAARQGEYVLVFRAVDNNGDTSATLQTGIFLENRPPRLHDPVLPDTVQRPQSGTTIIDVRITVRDGQGSGDIQQVTMTVQRQGGQPTTIEMFDDGDFDAHRDEAAGDGIFSRGLTVDAGSTPGTFTFTFVATDRVNNLSPAVVDTLVLLP